MKTYWTFDNFHEKNELRNEKKKLNHFFVFDNETLQLLFEKKTFFSF